MMERCGGDGAWSGPRGRRKRRERRRKDRDGASEEQEEERQRRRLQEARADLLDSEFWNSSLKTLLRSVREVLAHREEVPVPTRGDALLALEELQLCPPALPPGRGRLRCVCYGLGNFSSCFKARFQLAFLLLLLKELQIPEELCCIFDPAFSTLEREVLSGLGVSVLSRNEEGKRPVDEPTVFYMVHCGKALYNNLLWSNWSAGALSQMVVVGNSFKGIEERVPARIFQTDYTYIAKILAASEEAALPPHARYLDVFNDTAVHHFPLHKLRGVPQETWDFQKEPVYRSEDQLEIIRNRDAT